ncbi:vanadium-dependent haloperoxidase [Bradyrhizobium guangzhouense]|nr:vanadium-dependent haloperoxidase [Bradyrhizobium guangzhouense]
MFEAVNAIIQRHKSYKGSQAAIWSGVGQPGTAINPKTASVRAALASAAYDTLAVLYKNKIAYTKVVFNRLELAIDDPLPAVQLGARIGSEASKVILATRKYDPGTGKFGDGSKAQVGLQSLSTEPRFTDLFKGPVGTRDWDIDPISQLPVALGGHWNEVMPFVVADLHLPPGPPAENDPKFKSALDAVRRLGGDPAPPALGSRFKTPTSRKGSVFAPLDSSNETLKGIYWAYDGTPLLCAPPRLYNEIALSVAFRERPIKRVEDLAQYLAFINVAMAEAGIGAWTGKYKFHHSRPVTYIRKTDPEGSVLGSKNKEFTPLGAQVSNGTPAGANLTPPFPAYPSGHAVFGGAVFEAMRLYLRGDTAFTFVSDEYNGLNRGPTGATRPKFERKFKNLTEAEIENGQSRIWLGIHWQYDADDGIKQGKAIAKDVFDTFNS